MYTAASGAIEAREPPEAAGELRRIQRQVFIGTRWALFAATLAGLAFHHRDFSQSVVVEVLAVMIAYHALVLIVLWRLPLQRFAPAYLLAISTLVNGSLCALTGGLTSPFAYLFFLLPFAGAVYYEYVGALTIACAGCVFLLLASFWNPHLGPTSPSPGTRFEIVPQILIGGALAGFLVNRLKRLYERLTAVEQELSVASAEHETVARDRRVAREIQRATLVDPLEHPSFETAIIFEPAEDIGGDFYSFKSEEGRLVVVVGDVSGKGITAALVSTTLCHLAQCLPAVRDPHRFLSLLNRELVDRLPEWAFATLVLGVIDWEEKQAVLFNAGHPPPFILRGEELECIDGVDLPLGVDAQAIFHAQVIPFHPGDTLVLYTDAFIEARTPSGEQLEIEGFGKCIQAHASDQVGGMADRLVADVRSFGKIRDDLTLVMVRSRLASD